MMPLFSMSRIQPLPLLWSLSNPRLHTVSSTYSLEELSTLHCLLDSADEVTGFLQNAGNNSRINMTLIAEGIALHQHR